MNNGSLKEQLEAVASQLSEIYPREQSPRAMKPNRPKSDRSIVPHKKPHSFSAPTEVKMEKLKPKWLDYIHYGIELLKIYYPDCFKSAAQVLPLKKGIKQDLAKALSLRNDIVIEDKACMVRSLSYYVNTQAYLNTMKEGSIRVGLDGSSSDSVNAEEALYSQSKNALKQKNKLSPEENGTKK